MIDKLVIHSEIAAYTQIENHILFAVAAGKLKSGEKLPSARELGERLGINPNTVGKSYQDLAVMCVVRGNPGRGFFVTADARERCREDCYRSVIERLHRAISEAKAAGISKVVLSKALGVSYGSKVGIYEGAPKNVLATVKRARK